MSLEKETQIQRILSMYNRLKNGETLVKKEEAARFQISEIVCAPGAEFFSATTKENICLFIYFPPNIKYKFHCN